MPGHWWSILSMCFAHFRSTLGESWPKSAQHRSRSTDMLEDFGQSWVSVVETVPRCPKSTEFDRCRPHFGQLRPEFVKILEMSAGVDSHLGKSAYIPRLCMALVPER